MKAFRRVAGRAYPWGAKNVDTDLIIPGEYLKVMTRKGLGRGAFESLRADPDNIFDDPCYAGAPILIAGDNFGCGSSREHAAWALDDMGVRVVIAPSFSDIFSGNAVKNGILPVVLAQSAIDRLLEVARTEEIAVDLETCNVDTPDGELFAFSIEPFRRQCLLEGLDEIGASLAIASQIDAFERRTRDERPWLGAARTEAAYLEGVERL